MRARPRFRRASAVLAAASAALMLAMHPGAIRPPSLEIAAVDGPLDLRVVHPAAGAPAPTSGFAYLTGSVGSGRARLRINGRGVDVLPNGAFVAYLPSPPADNPAYRLDATLDGRTVTRVVPLARGTAVHADSSSSADAGRGLSLAPDETRWVRLGRAGTPSAEGVAVRTVPGGTYRWFLLPGTRVRATERRGGQVRIRLDAGTEGWVDADDARPLAADATAPAGEAGNVAVRVEPEWTDVAIALAEPAPFLVREEGSSITLTLYGTRGNTDQVHYPSREGWVRGVAWEPAGDGVRYTARLAGPAYGYRVFWRNGRMVLRLRHPPTVSRWRSPLRGKVVAIDPGHPPLGAVGPTGLGEAEATLSVARQLEAILSRRGARVVLTRGDPGPVGLEARAARAEAAGAHVLVSIHLDAVPGSTDPRSSGGTSTHFHHPHAQPLAHAVQSGVLRRLGLRDRGVKASNLAMIRPTWIPAVLCEGATLVVPEHEAALRTPAFREAYARGIADGLEAFFAAAAVPAP